MSEHDRDLTEYLEQAAPMAFKACHPRNITPPPGYSNPLHYAATMVGNLATVLNPAMNQLPHLTAYTATLALIANKVPTYFIAHEFCLAVANTDLPGDFKFAEIKWPMDAVLFVLPDRFVTQYFGCHAPFLALARCLDGMYPDVLRAKLPKIDIEYTRLKNVADKLMVDYPVYGGDGTPTDYNGSYPLSADVDVFNTADWVDSTAFESEFHGLPPIAVRPEGLSREDEQVYMGKMLRFALKLIMAVSCRPGLVEHGQLVRPAKVKRGRVMYREMWSPNVIGRSYRIPRQGVAQAGARSKPRFTFRRGHYTWQAKRFKGVEFVSVEAMPHKEDGTIDFDTAGNDLSSRFRTVHERLWIEGILFGADMDADSSPHATAP